MGTVPISATYPLVSHHNSSAYLVVGVDAEGRDTVTIRQAPDFKSINKNKRNRG